MIGLIDSGMGGLYFLKCFSRHLNGCNIVALLDQMAFPYGSKSSVFLYQRLETLIDYLTTHYDIKVLVLACNTLTTDLIARIRKKYNLLLVGVEPPIKTAALDKRVQNIATIATPVTLESKRYQALKLKHASHKTVFDVPCEYLAQWVERDEQNSITNELKRLTHFFKQQNINGLVLGCTHYSFLKEHPLLNQSNLSIFCPSQGVTERLKNVLKNVALTDVSEPLRILTTGSKADFECISKFKDMHLKGCSVEMRSIGLT